MELQEFKKYVSEASEKAHLFVMNGYSPQRVRSVSLRVDDDGVLSIVLHSEHMPKRVETDETAAIKKTAKLMKQFKEAHGIDITEVDSHFYSADLLWPALQDIGVDIDPFDNVLDAIDSLDPTKHDALIEELAPWASAAMDDDKCCDELKAVCKKVLEAVGNDLSPVS